MFVCRPKEPTAVDGFFSKVQQVRPHPSLRLFLAVQKFYYQHLTCEESKSRVKFSLYVPCYLKSRLYIISEVQSWHCRIATRPSIGYRTRTSEELQGNPWMNLPAAAPLVQQHSCVEYIKPSTSSSAIFRQRLFTLNSTLHSTSAALMAISALTSVMLVSALILQPSVSRAAWICAIKRCGAGRANRGKPGVPSATEGEHCNL